MNPRSLVLPLAVFFIAGAVNLQLPMYGAIAQDAGLGSGAMALLLAGYVGALLPTLVLLGGISDRVGRKPAVLAALVCAALATGITIWRNDALGLGIARWLQGLSVGLGFGAATAWISEREGPLVAAGRTSLMSASGFGAGAIVTAAWVHFWPSAAAFTFSIWIAGLLALIVAVARLESPPTHDPTSRIIRLPSWPPGSILPSLSVIVSWGVAGIVVAVLPGVIAPYGAGWSGAVLFAMLVGGLLVQRHTRRVGPSRASRLGNITLPIGVVILAAGVVAQSVAIVVLGAVVAGTCTHGYGYAGGLAEVTGLGDSPARTVSGYFVAAYVGFGAPAVGMGLLVDAVGAPSAFVALAVAVVILAAGLLYLERRGSR